MKANILRISILLGCVALITALAATARAQDFSDPGYGVGPQQGFATALPYGTLDGPVWLRYTLADQGLGYENGYTTLGALIPIWNAAGDAHWFTEIQGNISDEGNFFGNVGVGRRIYEHKLRRSFGWSLWFDHDGDEAVNFGHSFQQGGISFDSHGDLVDFHFNGYIPMRDEYFLGGRGPGFVGNRIVLLRGIDAALRGADFETGIRLPVASALDLRAYIGGYAYGTPAIDNFLGISGRIESHPAEYVTTSARINHDERFGTTGMLAFELHLGGRRNRGAYERMAEPVRRNDHIVRFHQNPVFAINPATGLPYNVVHINNTASPNGQGTFEVPFTTLAQGQAFSMPNDVLILTGGGNAYGGGIVLQDGQFLIGSGRNLVVRNGVLTVAGAPNGLNRNFPFLPGIAQGVAAGSGDGSFFQVVASSDIVQPSDIQLGFLPGAMPVIINPGGNAVTLADDNLVNGVQTSNSAIGIQGININNFNLQYNTVINNSTAGIQLFSVSGSGIIRNNTIVDNNRPTPPVTPNVPFANGLEITVGDTRSLGTFIQGNTINDNDTGIRIVANTTGTVFTDIVDNRVNMNVNDGIRLIGLGTGAFTTLVRGTGIVVDPQTALAPVGPLGAPLPTIPSAQLSFNGSIDKVTDNDGNGRGLFADVLNGNFGLLVDTVTLDSNDSSFFPRYGAIQLNVEPAVITANVVLNNNLITRTGEHVRNPANGIPGVPDSVDAGSGIRVVSNPGFGAVHNVSITNNRIVDNFSDGIKILMLTEGLRTAAIPEGTLRVDIDRNIISGNRGVADDNGGPQSIVNGITTVPYPSIDIGDDFDSPTANGTGGINPAPLAGPFQGFDSNPDPRNEFVNNLNGSAIIVRAKGTDNAQFVLDITNNTISMNAYDAINMAFAGRGNIDYVPSVAGAPLTPVPVFNAISTANPAPTASVPFSTISPDNFGVNAVVTIDNNIIVGGPALNTLNDPNNGASDDLIKVTIMDGARVAMQITNNSIQAGAGASGTFTATPPGFPSADLGFDTGIEIDTWDNSRLMLVIDNNDIFDSGAVGFNDGGIDLRSHHNSIMAMRITRNRINDVSDSPNGGTNGGAGINLLSEGNSDMIAFVNNNDIFNGALAGSFFEATSADTARLCLQLQDNNAEAGNSPQGNQSFTLAGNAFYLVQTENSVFELEPTRATNNEFGGAFGQNLPESQAITTYGGLLIAPPGAVLPGSNAVQFGNVGSGTCQVRLNNLGGVFPLLPSVVGFSDFDPPVVHP